MLSNYYAVSQGDLANEIALAQRPGPDRADGGELPRIHRRRAGHRRSRHGRHDRTGRRDRLRLPGDDADPARPAHRRRENLEGLRRGRRQRAGPEQRRARLRGQDLRNPFAYFHSLLDSGECAASDVGLDQLALDLKNPAEMPTFSYIVPNACHDGSELPCAPGQPAGMAGAESFLETVVPEIESSPAYTVGGMIAITFAQAPQTGPAADQRSCCVTPEYPNLKADPNAPPAPAASGPVKPTGGGGRVGMLLISPYVLPGSVNKSGYFNHFVLLRSIEELFGLTALGYAADPAIVPFDESVYNNLES